MIIDKIENLNNYEAVLPAIKQIICFLEDYKACPKAEGKYEIDGENLFASVQKYTTCKSTSNPEAHKKYIDVQCVLDGVEQMDMAALSTLTEVEERFSKGQDVAFYDGIHTTKTVLSAGDFAILFPQDAHCPGLMYNDIPCEVEKIVFKVKI